MTKEILTDSKVMDLFKGNERAFVYYNYDTKSEEEKLYRYSLFGIIDVVYWFFKSTN